MEHAISQSRNNVAELKNVHDTQTAEQFRYSLIIIWILMKNLKPKTIYLIIHELPANLPANVMTFHRQSPHYVTNTNCGVRTHTLAGIVKQLYN